MERKKQDNEESKSVRRSKKPKPSAKQAQKGHHSRELSAMAKEASRKKKKATKPRRPEGEVVSSTAAGLSAVDAAPLETTERSGTGKTIGQEASRHQSSRQKGDGAADVAPVRASELDGNGGGLHETQSVVPSGRLELPQVKPASASSGSIASPGLALHSSSPNEHHAPEELKGQRLPDSCDSENVKHDRESPRRHSLAELRKTSLALPATEKALSEMMGAAELSSEAYPIVVSVLPTEQACGSESRQSTEAANMALMPGRRSRPSEGNLDNPDTTTRSGYRRSQVFKLNEAVTVRAAMDRRCSTVAQKRGISKWSSKSSVAVFSAVSACITLLLLLAVYVGHKRQTQKTCATSACSEFSRSLRNSMNASVKPCDNFGKFVCNGWRRKHDMSVAEMSFVAELESIGQTLLRVPIPSKQEQQSALQKAAILYRSCDSVRQGTHNELNAVRQALRSEDIVWPRRSSKPDVLRTLIRSSLVLQWGAIFDVTLEAKSRDVYVRIEPSRMFAILHDRFVELYHGIAEREAYFSILRANFKDDDTDLLDFRTVNDLDTAAFSTLPQRVDRSSYEVALDADISLGGADHVTEDEWREAVNPFVPSNETGRIVVSTRSETFFLQFLELWKTTGRESMHTFLSWCVVQVAAPYANEQLQINLYGSKGRAQLVQGASCLARAFIIAGTEVFSAYNDIVMDDRTRFAAQKLIQSVCRTFLLRLHNWEHFNADVQVLQKRETGEVPWHVVHASFMEGEDSAVDMTDSLVHNWHNAPVVHTAEGFLRYDVYSAIEYAKLLVLMDRDFVLMPYALALPHFDGDATAALNYAGIGSTIAFALVKLLIAAYGASVADVASIFPSHQCVGNQSANATASDEELLAMLRAAAIRTSFYAYQREWGTEDYVIKGLEGHSAEEVFFMASCFALCSGSAEDNDDGEACNAHLRRVDQFASAFKCDPGTPMNPGTNCSTMQ